MEKTLLKGLQVLEALAQSAEPRGVTELAAQLGITKANAHRLLRTLLSAQYVIQDPTSGRYALSMRMWEMGVAVLSSLELSDVARPRLRELCDEADESVQLAILQGTDIVYIDKADSRHPLRATTTVGGRVPAYTVSTGKALLAYTSGTAGMRFPLKRFTASTLATRELLEHEFAQILEAGYAINRGEWREGVWGIAAPIRDMHGSIVAAVDVWGPELRFRGTSTTRLARQVMACAADISHALGFRAPATRARSRKVT